MAADESLVPRELGLPNPGGANVYGSGISL